MNDEPPRMSFADAWREVCPGCPDGTFQNTFACNPREQTWTLLMRQRTRLTAAAGRPQRNAGASTLSLSTGSSGLASNAPCCGATRVSAPLPANTPCSSVTLK